MVIKKKQQGNKYPKPAWAIGQVVRASGLVEDVCSCGVGHPSEAWLLENDPTGKKAFAIHGCCGCCSKSIREIRKGKVSLLES